MTVKRLIEELSKLNPDLIVYLSNDNEGNTIRPIDEPGCYSLGRFDGEDGWFGEFELEDGEQVGAICLYPVD
jgi:hypothetical protein